MTEVRTDKIGPINSAFSDGRVVRKHDNPSQLKGIHYHASSDEVNLQTLRP